MYDYIFLYREERAPTVTATTRRRGRPHRLAFGAELVERREPAARRPKVRRSCRDAGNAPPGFFMARAFVAAVNLWYSDCSTSAIASRQLVCSGARERVGAACTSRGAPTSACTEGAGRCIM
jgi:hypothetical protein